MACYHPVQVHVRRKPLFPGARRISEEQTVPCGKCLGCRADQARDWSVRIMHEVQIQDSRVLDDGTLAAAWFVTLTYSEENLPENGSLCSSDLQGFFKSLRRDYPPGSLSYYACGEYGESSQRPHYHAVLLGPDFLDRYRWTDRNGSAVWRSAALESHWPFGNSEFGTVTAASAAYVAGYVRKKISKLDEPDAYLRVDPETGELVEVEPEFSRMSLKPALGRRFIEKYWKDVYPRDFVVMDGKEFKPPRYYDKWMEQSHDPPCDGGCRAHQEVLYQTRLKRYKEAVELSRAKLDAKEKIHQARVSLFQPRNKV